MYRKILVPISRGAESEQGVIEGVRLARFSQAALCFIHVVDESALRGDRAGFAGSVDDFLALTGRRCADLVDGARARAEAAGVHCEVVLRDAADGETCELIASQALAWRAEVIVMGAAAVRGIGLRPGSVGARILRASPVPVIAISPRANRR
jgi:nucleotide-binding universal stress UspA family protein